MDWQVSEAETTEVIERVLAQLNLPADVQLAYWRLDSGGVCCKLSPAVTAFVYRCENVSVQHKTIEVDFISSARIEGWCAAEGCRLFAVPRNLVIRAGKPMAQPIGYVWTERHGYQRIAKAKRGAAR